MSDSRIDEQIESLKLHLHLLKEARQRMNKMIYGNKQEQAVIRKKLKELQEAKEAAK